LHGNQGGTHREGRERAATDEGREKKTAANARLRAILAHLSTDTSVPFVCECEDPECLARVELTLRGYDDARATGKAVRLPEHANDRTDRSQRQGNGA
jgi:hypothetical protein